MSATARHERIVTLEEFDAIDTAECTAGYLAAQRGDPEPGMNHSRSYHHGWRTRMMDLGEIQAPVEHMRLVRAVMDRERIRRGERPRGPWGGS